jgi:hypothetical protein
MRRVDKSGPLQIGSSAGIEGRDKAENQQAAELLKILLEEDEGDDQVVEVTSSCLYNKVHSSCRDQTSAAPTDTEELEIPVPINSPSSSAFTDLLNEAFQREYKRPVRSCRSMSHFGGGDQAEERANQHNHQLIGESFRHRTGSLAPSRHEHDHPYTTPRQEHTISQAIISSQYSLKRPKSPRAPSKPLLLPGLGDKRQRNRYGKSLEGGQEHGIGVIGSVAGDQVQEQVTMVVNSQAGCDIPMMRGGTVGPDDAGLLPLPIQHRVSLDPDLPPLAVEHPARVWNSMLHSLGASLQPIVKWDYERNIGNDLDSGEQQPLACKVMTDTR